MSRAYLLSHLGSVPLPQSNKRCVSSLAILLQDLRQYPHPEHIGCAGSNGVLSELPLKKILVEVFIPLGADDPWVTMCIMWAPVWQELCCKHQSRYGQDQDGIRHLFTFLSSGWTGRSPRGICVGAISLVLFVFLRQSFVWGREWR